MKNLIFVISVMFIYGCNTNPNYERNLATAKKLFELHGKEDLDGQLELISDKIQSNSSLYGSETAGYDQYVNMLKGYHAAFDNVKYTANIWLPGTDSLGNLDGSVRTYGNWTGVNVATGKELNLHGYWYMNFDEDGKVIGQGDYFDFGGIINAVYPKNLVFIQIAVKKGKKDEIIKSMNKRIKTGKTKTFGPGDIERYTDLMSSDFETKTGPFFDKIRAREIAKQKAAELKKLKGKK